MTASTITHLLHQSADRLDTAKHANSDHAAQAQAEIAQVLATQALVAATLLSAQVAYLASMRVIGAFGVDHDKIDAQVRQGLGI